MAPVDIRDYDCITQKLLFRFGAKHLSTLPANTTLTQCWSNAGPPCATLAQHETSTGSTPRICWAAFNPVNTKHLYNICTLWAHVVQMLYKCFVLAGNSSWSGTAYCWRRLQADTDPMYVKCWAGDAGQYPFSPSQYIMLPVPACWRYGHDALNQSWVNVSPLSVMLAHIQGGAKHDTVTQLHWANNVGSASWTVGQH